MHSNIQSAAQGSPMSFNLTWPRPINFSFVIIIDKKGFFLTALIQLTSTHENGEVQETQRRSEKENCRFTQVGQEGLLAPFL